MIVDPTLPGAELVSKGLKDFDQKKRTAESLLLLIGAPRLRQIGFSIPISNEPDGPELALYRLLLKKKEIDAYSLYNSYIRRLISFEQAMEARR